MVVTNAQFIKPLIVPMLLSVLFYLGALRYQLKPEVIKGNILQNELEWRFIKDESLRFEIKKISSAMPLLISIATVAVIVSLVFIQVSVNDQQRISYFLGESGHVQLFEEEIANQEAKIEQMREVMNDPDLSEEQREETFILLEHEKQSLIGLKTSLREYTSLKTLYEEKNYERFYRIAQNQVKSAFGMDANVENPEAIVFNEYVEGRPSNFAYEVSLEYNNQLKERQISPVLGTQRIDTVYDEYVSQQAKNEAAIYNTPAIMSGLNIWHRFSMVYYFDFILIALSVFFFGSGFVLEKESGNHHGLMLTQPQTKSKLTEIRYSQP